MTHYEYCYKSYYYYSLSRFIIIMTQYEYCYKSFVRDYTNLD